MTISLRNVTSEDEAFLLAVYASTRAAELAQVPWTDEQREAFLRMQFQAQHSHYRERYPDADYKVIMRDDEPVGRLYLLREPDKMRILDITVLPAFGNCGIGAGLIQDVLDEGARTNRKVHIYVENFNPSLAFFQKRNFSVLEEDGFNLLLEWNPPAASSESK
ncbi:MAG TPA: GNAT family N-acetyltransferase [Pyrinomonadaceae bacterium]|nr:GNAT family N-acetyltransferase [Pyrinomonadaceae bacterium]